MPNRLALETSPYLQQHRDNPVDWYPWGPEALGRARAENKPILLSVGYSACHWCHVMAHESFENEATAQIMNAHFVNVKVDREERPDIDAIYMQAVQAMTGQGGWPMTVFLTPSAEPFYGGTYFPPADRHGMPSFTRILTSVADAWATKPEDIARAAASVSEIYAAAGTATRATTPVSIETLDRAAADLSARFEPMSGGFGGAPKFPQAMALEFLLRRFARTKDPRALQIVEHSFQQMARGGIYDQVGGGFHRYSVDARWLVPHFEKMLYDNALLARVGAHLFQMTGDGEAARVTEETLGWVMTEMTDAGGGWYSSLDADSEHEEGKFYVWSIAELREILGGDAHDAIELWGATESGNFEGANILHLRAPLDESRVAKVAEWKKKLYEVRKRRVWPGLDNKIVASWNGLMLRAMAECARVFDNAEWKAAALRNGEFLWREMVRDGRVYRTHTRGETRIPGFLEDQAAVALGFLALHQLTLENVWFERAMTLVKVCVEKFRDAATGDFFDSASDAETLITRPRDVTDNATPAGTSLAAELLLMIAEMTGDVVPGVQARQLIDSVAEPMARYATMFGHLLCAADMSIAGGRWADFVCGPNGCALPAAKA